MKPDSLEDSIQSLLSALYPPFESTAPTLLGQLFKLIEGRYHGDALRCLLDFLVPAKHILDSVQQAACSQYPNSLFLYEGWPLCLRDRVVIHLSPLDPHHLCPGDFYLQAAPFCDQSARIVVCSLLEEEGLRQEVIIEETPIPETSYPCIFSLEWLAELNQDRNGTPLSHCLLATEQGVVRLPWDRVAGPEFVDSSQWDRNIMASVPSSYPPIPPPLPSFHKPLSNHTFKLQNSTPKDQPAPVQNQNFSVQTKICPGKHGIAVSLCLVDNSISTSSRQLNKVKESDEEAKPVGWVSPNTWDSRCTSRTDSQEMKISAEDCQNLDSDNTGNSKSRDQIDKIAEGEYIDVMQATVLFGNAQLNSEHERQQQSNPMQKFPQLQTFQPQMDPYMQTQGQLTTFSTSSKLPPRPHTRSPPTISNNPASHQHSHSDSPESSPCFRTIRFSEKPCTPCMQRKQIGQVSKAQELRCRYRDSYQAAIQNPVNLGKDKAMLAMCAVLEEEGDSPQVENHTWHMRNQYGSFQGICKESEEKNLNYGKPADMAACVEYQGTSTSKQDQTSERTTVTLRQPRTNANGLPPRMPNVSSNPMQPNYTYCSNEGMNYCEQLQNRANSFRVNSGLFSPQSRREPVQSDGRGSSLSTAVVDTSEKCDVVIVDGKRVRRKENSSLDVPQLHVVKCKNSTAFRLVSPKINRRKLTVPDAAQTGPSHSTEIQSKPPPAPVQRSPLSLTARPRPDHLPLGSADPRTHPLLLGVTALTGGRDKSGRAIVEVYGENQGWRGAVTSQELFKVLLYFYSIVRREIREAGVTVIFDARKSCPQPQLYKALMSLEELSPRSVHSLVLLIDKDNKHRPERCPGIQTEVLTSMKSLLKLVESGQLSPLLDGTLPQGRCDWTELNQKLFPFVCDLHETLDLLLRAISKLQKPKRTDTVQCVQQHIVDQRILMRDVLEDSRLVSLQREGGAMLARLRKESDFRYPLCEDLSDAVDSVSSLYNQVEEQVHVLVQRSNMSLEHLEYLVQLREMQGHFSQMQQWFDEEGARHLLEAVSVEDSGEQMEQVLNSFTGFLIEANDRRHHAMSLVTEAERLQQSGASYPETDIFRAFVNTFKSSLEEFLCRAEACGRDLQTMVNVCDFCEQATALATECMEYLDQSHSKTPTNLDQLQDHTPALDQDSSLSQPGVIPPPAADPSQRPDSELTVLHSFLDRFDHFSAERFQEVKVQAGTLRGSRAMRVWNMACLRCQEARQQLEERVQERTVDNSCCEHHYIDVVSTDGPMVSPGGQGLVVQSTPGPGHPQWDEIVSGAVDLGNTRFMENSYNPVKSSGLTVKPEESTGQRADVPPQSPPRSLKKSERESRRRQAARARSERDAAALSQSHTVGCQWFPWSPRLSRGLGRSVSQDSCSTKGTATRGSSSSPEEERVRCPSTCSHHGQPSCRILQEAQKFQISRHGSFCSEESCLSERGAAGGRALCYKHTSLPMNNYDQALCLPKTSSNSLRLQRVLEELVYTEQDYVRSLGYILTHYLPLLDRPDVPQDLRGKRGVIFGNLEKLYDFHSHYFLPELEACEGEPALVARCFLRHSESFGLYALYSKNKPKSDVLILYRRHDIFKKKQQELGDLMDLSSYLLRPIQRISKYSLLLQDMLSLVGSYHLRDQDSLCGPGGYIPDCTIAERERERAEIQAAADLVRFQMRHGNDLLTMDAIRDCDVNLKEQGQLIRQDEFTVIFKKKKCVRRVFLFEDLILFSKAKKTDVGNDVYVYKQSFKTSDIGMTHNSALSGLCFEIWFRRRKSEDTYTLRAASVELKRAWTMDLEKILWDQAAHSREMRLQERVFMGIGHKSFMDIQPSDAAICDRSVNCVLPGRIPVACCSHRGLVPRPNSIGSGSTASTTLSQSSSSSGRGSLPPAGYHGNQCLGTEAGVGVCSSPEAVADNELNQLHLHQHHLHHCERWRGQLPLLDSTDSSGDCGPVFSSDQSCLSAIGAEVLDSSSSFRSRRRSLCGTPSLRTPSSPALSRKSPGLVPKTLSLPTIQGDKIVIGKSTEV